MTPWVILEFKGFVDMGIVECFILVFGEDGFNFGRMFVFEGRLWIHAAGKVPERATIKAMEDFYREIYGLDGITDVEFPQHYPVSRLLGTCKLVILFYVV